MAYAEDDKKKVKRGVIITLIGKVAEMSQGVYLFLARYLFGGEAFGLFVIGFNVMELLFILLSILGMRKTQMKRISIVV